MTKLIKPTLMAEAVEIPTKGGGSKEGLMSRLAKFAADSSTAPETSVAPTVQPASQEAPPVTIQRDMTNPDMTAAPATIEKPEPVKETIQFPKLAAKTQVPATETSKGFDPKAFDTETDEVIASLEAKGHPGDVYRKLRTELKAMKETVVAPDSIPEVAKLKAEVEKLRKIEEVAEGLRQRNEKLMRLADETAIREDDEFIEKVTKPIAAMEETVTAIAEAYPDSKLKAEDIYAIIEEKNLAKQTAALDRLESVIGRRNVGRIERFIDDYGAIMETQKTMLAEASQRVQMSRKQRDEADSRAAAAKSEQYQEATREAFAKYAKAVPGFTDSSGALTGAALALQNEAVSVDIHSLSPGDLAFMAFAMNVLPEMKAAIVRLQEEKAILMSGKTARAPFAGEPGTPKSETRKNPRMGLIEAMRGKNFTWSPNGVG